MSYCLSLYFLIITIDGRHEIINNEDMVKENIPPDENHPPGNNVQEDQTILPIETHPALSKFTPQWTQRNVNCHDAGMQFQWTLPAPSLDTQDSPVQLFEKQLMQLICHESECYGVSNGHPGFNIDINEFKLFITILLISRYIKLPR